MPNTFSSLDPFDSEGAAKALEADTSATKPAATKPAATKPTSPVQRSSAKPVEELPQWRNNVAAFVQAAATGATMGLEFAVAPPVGIMDLGMTIAGQSAPLAKRLGVDREPLEKSGFYAPSAQVGRAAVKGLDYIGLGGGDPAKGNEVSGWLGALVGVDPVKLAQKGVREGVKAATGELAKQGAGLAGAHIGTMGVGKLAGGLLLPEDSSEEEREAVGSILGAPYGMKTGRGIAEGVHKAGGVIPYLDTLKTAASRKAAEQRIRDMEAAAPVERTLDERRLVRTLIRQGATEREAIAMAKKASAGIYGGVAKTEPILRRVAEAAKSAVVKVVGSATTETPPRVSSEVTRVRENSDIVNRVISTVTDMRNALKDNGTLVDPTLPAKAEGAKQRVRSGVHVIGQALSNVPQVMESDGFRKWLPAHVDLTHESEDAKRMVVGKYLVRAAIDNYYEQHVEPVKRELMDIPVRFYTPKPPAEKPEATPYGHAKKPVQVEPKPVGINRNKFMSEISNMLVAKAYPYNTVTAQGMVSGFTKQVELKGAGLTVNDIYNFMNGVENSNALPEAFKGEIKQEIINILEKHMPGGDLPGKYERFKAAYRPYGSELKEKSPMYRLSEYDATNTTTADSALKHYKTGTAESPHITLNSLARENPDIAHTVINGLYSELGRAVSDADTPEAGSKAVVKLLQDHLERLDSLGQALPNGHPAKQVLDGLGGVLQTAKDHVELAKQVKETAKALESQQDLQKNIDKHRKVLKAYGEYAVKAFDSLSKLAFKDEGMFNALKESQLARSTPIAHDIAKELMAVEGGNPDLTKHGKLIQALSMANGTNSAVTDLMKYGIGQLVHKTTEEGVTDKKATLQALGEHREKIHNYLNNIDTLLRTTPGLSPEDVASSRAYIGHVRDALEVAGNDLVLKAINKAYGEISIPKSENIAEQMGVPVLTLTNQISSEIHKAFRVGYGVFQKFAHSKESIDAAILEKLDDRAFMAKVSNLRTEFLSMRESEVTNLLESNRPEGAERKKVVLQGALKKVLGGIWKGTSGVFTGWLDAMQKYPKQLGSYYALRKAEMDDQQAQQQKSAEGGNETGGFVVDPEHEAFIEDMRKRAGR